MREITAALGTVLTFATSCVTSIRVEKPAPALAEAPAFALTAQDGQKLALADVLAKEHAVLVFYRGHW